MSSNDIVQFYQNPFVSAPLNWIKMDMKTFLTQLSKALPVWIGAYMRWLYKRPFWNGRLWSPWNQTSHEPKLDFSTHKTWDKECTKSSCCISPWYGNSMCLGLHGLKRKSLRGTKPKAFLAKGSHHKNDNSWDFVPTGLPPLPLTVCWDTITRFV